MTTRPHTVPSGASHTSALMLSPMRRGLRHLLGGVLRPAASPAAGRSLAAMAAAAASAEAPVVLLVESPAKAKKIQQYLGDTYRVLATYGHVRDLPDKPGSVAPDDDFKLRWRLASGARARVQEIAAAVRSASGRVVLATDPDREGEAISWHLVQELQGQGVLDPGAPPQRITFTEVTPGAVAAALAAPRALDAPLVDAYFGRRALDYLYGFHLSPLLWRKLPGARSAGRVQSVALRLVAEREAAIETFRPVPYWTVEAAVALGDGGGAIEAAVTSVDGAAAPKPGFLDCATAEAVAARLPPGQLLVVRSAQAKEVPRAPPPPFTTSTLQQEANKQLGMGAARAMAAAQALYEAGHITYMRTDGVAVAEPAVAALRAAVEAAHGAEFLPPQPRAYSTRSKNAQEAHEAIRPTDPSAAPAELLAQGVEAPAVALYRLIRARALASQMASARVQQAAAEFETPDGGVVLRAAASHVTFPGYLAAAHREAAEAEDAAAAAAAAAALGALRPGDRAEVRVAAASDHATRAPARFTEGTLVKALEEQGVGRPSTYAPTLKTLQSRGYVRREGRALHAEPLGRTLAAFLSAYFESYVDLGFTSAMEASLDEVAGGEKGWKEVLEGFWGPFHQQVDEMGTLTGTEVLDRLNEDLAEMLFGAGAGGAAASAAPPPATPAEGSIDASGAAADADGDGGGGPRACPLCGSPLSLKLSGKKTSTGPFVGCSAHPACSYARAIGQQELSAAGDGEDEEEPPPGVAGRRPVHRVCQDAEQKYGMRGQVYVLGAHPNSGKGVFMRMGPFGPYIQLGEESDPDMRRVPLPKRTPFASVTMEYALSVLALPRKLGVHPETGLVVEVRNGKFGPFVLHQEQKRSIPKDIDPLEITLAEGLALLEKAKPGQAQLKSWDPTAAPTTKQRGRPRKARPDEAETLGLLAAELEGAPADEHRSRKGTAGRSGDSEVLQSPVVSLLKDMASQLPRPRTPYIIFMQEQKGAPADLQAPPADGSAKSSQPVMGLFMQNVAAKWRKLPEAERQVYYDNAEAERKSHAKSKKLLAKGLKLAAEEGVATVTAQEADAEAGA